MSERRRYLLLMGAILAAFVGALMLAIPGAPLYQKPTLGLDLQGGLEVVLQAQAPKGHTLTSEDLDRSISIMQKRINGIGVTEPEIRKQGSNQIVIQLAGVHDPAKAAKLIGKTAQLMLFDFEADLVPPSVDSQQNPIATPTLYGLLKQVQDQAAKGTPEAYYLFHTKTKTTKPAKKGGKPTTTVLHSVDPRSPAQSLQQLLKPFGGTVPKGSEVLKVPDHTIVVSCDATTGCLGVSTTAATLSGSYFYLLKYYPNGTGPNGTSVPEMTGADLVLSGTRADFGQTGAPVVLLQFTGHGSNQFQKITK